MDDSHVRQFFQEPQSTLQRRYEAFRAFFVEQRLLQQIAEQFGYKVGALKAMVSQFRAHCNQGDSPPFSSANRAAVRPGDFATMTPTGLKPPRPPIAGRSTGKTARTCERGSPARSSFCRC